MNKLQHYLTLKTEIFWMPDWCWLYSVPGVSQWMFHKYCLITFIEKHHRNRNWCHTGCPKKMPPKIFPATNMLDGWDISHLKGVNSSSVWSTKNFCWISGSRDIKKSKLDIIIRNFRYCLEFWCLILFCLYFGPLTLYTNGV